MDNKRIYACIDLKSFYASVECVERGLNPLSVNLVVADLSRSEKTICLAATPPLKSFGIKSRSRLFEVYSKVKEINNARRRENNYKAFSRKSFLIEDIKQNNDVALGFLIAPPRMALYMKYSARIYNTYLRFVSEEDIHVYSIDEVFIDITAYLKYYQKSAYEFVSLLLQEVFKETGITATAGIGSNLYLAKVAMDIDAKHIPLDKNGLRISSLNEMDYRVRLWSHIPLTDFWRIGRGIAKRLQGMGLNTMGDIARFSLTNEDDLYEEFGINAELIIDHAWGYEPCTIKDIKKYVPLNNSLSSGQVLKEPYNFAKAKIVFKEMLEQLILDIVSQKKVTNNLSIAIGYDRENENYKGAYTLDDLGRKIPKSSHASVSFQFTASRSIILQNGERLFNQIVDKNLSVRRLNIACSIYDENVKENSYEQLSLFDDYETLKSKKELEKKALEKEQRVQETILKIQKKFGKNALLRAMDLQEGATQVERNEQIGGHKA